MSNYTGCNKTVSIPEEIHKRIVAYLAQETLKTGERKTMRPFVIKVFSDYLDAHQDK